MSFENSAELQAILETLDPTTRTLVAEADLGNETSEWLCSSVGRYIVGCAQQEIASAHEQLSKTSPWRRRRIQELQNRIWRAESLLAWLRELLLGGHAAHQALIEVDYD